MPGRRQRIQRAMIAILAVVLFVGVPALLTAQPNFFQRYPQLAEKHEPWVTSTHLAAGCEGCHVAPGVVPQSLYRARMVGEFYVSLMVRAHVPDFFARPGNAACLSCHSDLRTVSPKGDLKIPHRAHVSILEMDCVECHSYLVHEKSPEGKHTPPMAGCMSCHDGDTAQDACSACHTEKAAPESHSSSEWIIRHAEQADDPACETCHRWAENWCADCHSQRPRSHGVNWRAAHGDRVKQHRSCEACHEGSFCERCHGRVPAENRNPALKLVE